MVEYRIYADNYLIYSSLTPEIAGLIQPKLKLEVNKSGSLSFTMPSNHEYFDDIHPMKTLILVYQDNDILFRGRVIEAKIDFFKQKKVTCEGDLSFLLDSVIRPFEYIGESKKKTIRQVFKKVIDDHNAQMIENSTWKRFSYDDSHITVTIDETKDVNATDEWNYTSFGDTSSVLNSEFLDVYGGLLMTRTVNQNGSLVTYLDYIKDPSQNPSGFITNQQEIEFGVNLLELDSSYPVSDIFTVLMPVGSDKLTIEKVNNNSPYLENQAAIAKFGRIVKVEQWSDVKKADELKQKGQKFLDQHGAIFSDDLTVKAIDLHYLGQSNHPLKLLDKVAVYSDPHDINTVLLCLSVEYDFQNPENNSYKLGTFIPSDKHKGKTKKSGGGGGGGRGGGGGTPTLSDTLNDDEEDLEYNKEGLVDGLVQTGKDLFSFLGDTPSWDLAKQLGIPVSSAWWDSLDPAGRAKAMEDALGSGYAEIGGSSVRVFDTITDLFNGNSYTEDDEHDPDPDTGKPYAYSGIKTLGEATEDIVTVQGKITKINGRQILIGDVGTELVSIDADIIDITGEIKNLVLKQLNAQTIESIKLSNAGSIETGSLKVTTRAVVPNYPFGSQDVRLEDAVTGQYVAGALQHIKQNWFMSNNPGDGPLDVKFDSVKVRAGGNDVFVVNESSINNNTLDGSFATLKVMESNAARTVATQKWVEDKIGDKYFNANFDTLQINDEDVATQDWVDTNLSNKTFEGNFLTLQIEDKDVATQNWVAGEISDVETKIGDKSYDGNFNTLKIVDKDVATQEWVTGQIPVQQAYSRVYLNGSSSMASIVRMKQVTINGVNVYAPD